MMTCGMTRLVMFVVMSVLHPSNSEIGDTVDMVPQVVKSVVKPPKPSEDMPMPMPENDIFESVSDWTGFWDDKQKRWFYHNKASNFTTWEAPGRHTLVTFDIPYRHTEGMDSLRHILGCEKNFHAGCQQVDKADASQARGTVTVAGLKLTTGGNFTQALKDNLREKALYNNIVKDIITFFIKAGGWTTLNVLLYGGSIFTSGLGFTRRRKRKANRDSWADSMRVQMEQYRHEMTHCIADIMHNVDEVEILEEVGF